MSGSAAVGLPNAPKDFANVVEEWLKATTTASNAARAAHGRQATLFTCAATALVVVIRGLSTIRTRRRQRVFT